MLEINQKAECKFAWEAKDKDRSCDSFAKRQKKKKHGNPALEANIHCVCCS